MLYFSLAFLKWILGLALCAFWGGGEALLQGAAWGGEYLEFGCSASVVFIMLASDGNTSLQSSLHEV